MTIITHEENSSVIFHISRENTKGVIFNGNQDYEIFVSYLKEYLTTIDNPENSKKTFNVRGRTFRGIPHQLQNFCNKVELLAYRLEPNRFDLLVKQIVPGSLEQMIRSLSTRYALYFNKKYERSGALFEKSYKTIQIKDNLSLLELIRNLLNFNSKDSNNIAQRYSSYPEYTGQRVTPWVKSEVILSLLGDNYKDRHLKKFHKSQPRIPEIVFAAFIFVLLSAYGLKNIQASSLKTQNSSNPLTNETPEVLSESVNKIEADQSPTPKDAITPNSNDIRQDSTKSGNINNTEENKSKTVVIKADDGSESVNIRKRPTLQSDKIGEAKVGDTFEYISIESGWYKIKLTDESTGYIIAKYIEIEKEGSGL